ncbi:FMN-binding protein [Microbacterium sp. ASV49]|uniref:FMN-binding protein n=1 Tax=Microbacterium candidum TaxID=3041922 RepID=A0ABT7MVH4_9MICO|nr:FMN-binding protein [Microbacterium sp. ASV49]MDL9978449.1 FMN-binding protein [Microbacterium sp. ASV49]
MKKIVWSILATVAGVVLLFSYRTSLDQTIAAPVSSGTVPKTTTAPAAAPTAAASPSASAASGSSGSAGSSGSSGSTGTSGSSGTTTTTSGLKNGTFTGQSTDTPYGPVQVKITVASGIITKVDVPRYPDSGGRDQEINSYALPQLVSETVQAQSAQIDMVSGATYTSQGYVQSLQSAIDAAHA